MTTLGPPDPAGWATTGVDLGTRRVRVLWGLAALGRTAEQRQFQARYQAFMEIDQALADGYVQARYQHIIISLTRPRMAQRAQARYRRRNPPALDHPTFLEVDPSGNRIEADDHAGEEVDAASDRSRMPRRWHVAEVLDRAMRSPERPTLPPSSCLNGDWPPSGPRAGRHQVVPNGRPVSVDTQVAGERQGRKVQDGEVVGIITPADLTRWLRRWRTLDTRAR